MKKSLILFIILLFLQQLNAQKIVWESEYSCFKDIGSTSKTIIKDKAGNYACVFQDRYSSYNNMFFIKYSPEGELLKYKVITKPYGIFPVSIIESEKGYKIFNGAWFMPLDFLMFKLPMVVEMNWDGDTMSESVPYKIDSTKLYEKNSIDLNPYLNNLVNINNHFFVSFSKENIPTGEHSYKSNYHIVSSCFDSLGRVIWRNGIDTNSGNTLMRLSGIAGSGDGKIYSLYQTYTHITNFIGWKMLHDKIIVMDTSGNLLNFWEYKQEGQRITFLDIIQIIDGHLVVIGVYSPLEEYEGEKKSGLVLWKINPDGIITKRMDIPYRTKYDYDFLLQETADGGFILSGRDWYFDNNTNNTTSDDSTRVFIRKYNSELEKVFDFGWLDQHADSMIVINNIYPIDNNNIIVTGCKDRYKFYIAQINIGKTDVKENLPGRQAALAVRPQPFRDVCEITVNDAAGQYLEVSLYDINGHKIMNLCSETAQTDKKSFIVNGSELAPGVYFVEAKTGGLVLREKIIKME